MYRIWGISDVKGFLCCMFWNLRFRGERGRNGRGCKYQNKLPRTFDISNDSTPVHVDFSITPLEESTSLSQGFYSQFKVPHCNISPKYFHLQYVSYIVRAPKSSASRFSRHFRNASSIRPSRNSTQFHTKGQPDRPTGRADVGAELQWLLLLCTSAVVWVMVLYWHVPCRRTDWLNATLL